MAKVCSKCNTEKELTDFHKNKLSPTGYRAVCKSCRSKYEGKSKQDKVRKQRWYKENKQITVDRAKDYYQTNRELRLEQVKIHKENNIEWYRNLQRIHQAHRRALKLKATPTWANKEKIKEIYMNCPTGYHVDHIVPLKGKHVTGLHVESNLQYLPASENIKKSNNFGGL